ncbi:hypothetical protein [Vibrio phage vB_VibM_83AMN]|nr:hypothetical protein [Vibrio phage vB_VibM_83AMN]
MSKSNVLGDIKNLAPNEQESVLNLLRDWETEKNALDVSKANEADLRADLVTKLFGDNTYDLKGTFKYQLLNNYRVSAVFSVRYAIDDAVLKAMMPTLHEQGIDVNELITWKPSLNEKAYLALDSDQKQIVDSFITSKQGTPQVKIELPKRR